MNINTSVRRACTLVRLNHMNRGIEPCDVYLLIVEEDDVASGGGIVFDGGM